MSKSVVMEEIVEPAEVAEAQARRRRFDRNFAWLQTHAQEIFARHRGMCICISGEELFVAETPQQAVALGNAAHPADDGSFVQYIPRERFVRIYAHRR